MKESKKVGPRNGNIYCLDATIRKIKFMRRDKKAGHEYERLVLEIEAPHIEGMAGFGNGAYHFLTDHNLTKRRLKAEITMEVETDE